MLSKKLSYGIIGDGRLASHLKYYLLRKGHRVHQWARKTHSSDELSDVFKSADIILVLISDDAISHFIEIHWDFLKTKKTLHGSGSLVDSKIPGFHFLCTFGKEFYSHETYESIPVIMEEGPYTFQEIFPDFSNPNYVINPVQKSFYHALCVLGGNFTTLLWQKVFKEFESKFHFPKEVAFIYLQQIVTNLLSDSANALTGPLARNDVQTIQKHLDILKSDPFKQVYESFVRAHENEKEVGYALRS